MGTFRVKIRVSDLDRRDSEELQALVDTGATTTVIPADILRRLGVSPTTSHTFRYANGEQVELGMAQIWARVSGVETITWVVFGEEGTDALLGAYTLEGVFLAVDPYNQTLVPVQGLLM